MSQKVISQGGRLDSLEEKMKIVEERLKSLEQLTRSIDKTLKLLEERTRSYPKLYDNVDKLVGEIVEHRQEMSLINAKLENHENRITDLETR